MAEIVAIGEILVEIMATEIGQTFLAPGLFRGPYPSGAPAIFADQAARMGARTALIGCVGPDDFGTLNLRRLEASGVETGWIRRIPDTTTGSAFVTYRPDGDRDFIFNIRNSASARLCADQLDPAAFAGCRFFHVMGSSLFDAKIAQTVREGAALAREAGALISFDPNIRKELLGVPEVRRTIEDILAEADLLLPSTADLSFLHPERAEDEAAELLMDGRRMVVLKKGAAGCMLLRPGGSLTLPALAVEEVDPTGAGDCFGATFVASLVRGVPADQALRLANAAGALAVQKQGPMEGNSTPALIDAFLQSRSG
jgi:fructokinase